MCFWVFSSQIVLSDREFHVKVLLCPLNLTCVASLTDRWMLNWKSGSGMWCNAYITNNMAYFVVQYTNSWSGRSWQQPEYFGWIFHQTCNSFSCLCAVPDIILYHTKLMTSLNLHLDIIYYDVLWGMVETQLSLVSDSRPTDLISFYVSVCVKLC